MGNTGKAESDRVKSSFPTVILGKKCHTSRVPVEHGADPLKNDSRIETFSSFDTNSRSDQAAIVFSNELGIPLMKISHTRSCWLLESHRPVWQWAILAKHSAPPPWLNFGKEVANASGMVKTRMTWLVVVQSRSQPRAEFVDCHSRAG